VSEPRKVRQNLCERIKRELAQQGFRERCEVHVLDAFKAGLCWLREVVVPQWRSLRGIANIELRFRPLDVNENEPLLDLKIRWLQELFPADELLAREFDIPLSHIRLSEHD